MGVLLGILWLADFAKLDYRCFAEQDRIEILWICILNGLFSIHMGYSAYLMGYLKRLKKIIHDAVKHLQSSECNLDCGKLEP